jgi:hypothetical protein
MSKEGIKYIHTSRDKTRKLENNKNTTISITPAINNNNYYYYYLFIYLNSFTGVYEKQSIL